MPPNQTVKTSSIPRRKKKKETISWLACCNADGTEILLLFIIGKSANPRCCKGRSSTELNLWYTSNSKSWMNFSIFSGWLKSFEEYVPRTNGRNFALLVDNALLHGRIQDLPVLSNVEVICLPKNSTSCLESLDAGVIASLKKRYRRTQYERALCLIEEENTQDLYNVNFLVACKTITPI